MTRAFIVRASRQIVAVPCPVCVAVWILAWFMGPAVAIAADAPNVWRKIESAEIAGRRWDVPLAFDPGSTRFLILGGRTTWADYKKPRPYDVLGLDKAAGHWENLYPTGKTWGPVTGACSAPVWKDEYFRFDDVEGNTRPNWTVYGTFSLGRKFAYDSDTKTFVFYAGGKTFRYDPAARVWTDLAPATHPEQELGGRLLWSAICYEPVGKRFILFGGGNVETPRGDPGTWSYSPEKNEWRALTPAKQPPQRANAPLVYDPARRKIVLFGGDRLDQLLSDTWLFDPATSQWEELRPPASPAPRAGHALLWLPKARKIVLVGGYTYTSAVGYVESLAKPLPLDLWTLDVEKKTWQRLRGDDRGDGGAAADAGKAGTAPRSLANACLPAAVDGDDRVCVRTDATWLVDVDATRVDNEGTAKHGVPPGTVERRTGPHDPAWFRENVPAPEPEKVKAELTALPANRWTLRPTPKLPRPNMDWGSAVFAPGLDLIVRYSGGHSAYSGTAPIVYDVKSDRYSLPFAPEYPIEYVYSNDQVNGEWSFQGRPWMTGHTYKSTGWCRHRNALVFAPHDYTYFFDPRKGAWSRSEERNPYRPNFYVVTLCDTPDGAVVWADRRDTGHDGLWRLGPDSTNWQPLPLTGELPAKTADQHGMVYDAKRNRLLCFSGYNGHGKRAGDVAAYDLKTGRAEWLEPTGRAGAVVQSRETVYLPELDAVLVGAKADSKKADPMKTDPAAGPSGWLLYDCAKNAWFAVDLPGDDPITRGRFNNSMGLMFDAGRKLVWAVGQNSHVHALKLDVKSLRREPLP